MLVCLHSVRLCRFTLACSSIADLQFFVAGFYAAADTALDLRIRLNEHMDVVLAWNKTIVFLVP